MAEVTRKDIRNIKQRALVALEVEFGPDYGISVTKSSFGYVGDITVEFAKADSDGKIVTGLESDFRFHARDLGLEPDDFGATFTTFVGDSYKIIGAKPGNRKYPIIAKKVGTKSKRRTKFAEQVIARYKQMGGHYWKPAE